MRAVCQVCMHQCSLEEGQRGLCGARENVCGAVVCANYGQVTSLAFPARFSGGTNRVSTSRSIEISWF